MIVTATEAAKRTAIINNLGKSMLVEAGAGAGKTTLVVNRNIEQIKKGTLTAAGLVDITFTKAAAEELRSRLLRELHRAANDSSNTPDERERLKAAIKDESLIQISTIHSFCKRLLTEQTFAARLPLDVRLLDNKEADERKARFFDAWYRKQSVSNLQAIEQEFYRGNASGFIFDTFMEICELPDDTNFIYDTALIAATAKKTADYIKDMHTKLDECFINLAKVVIDRLAPTTISSFADIKDAVLSAFSSAYDKVASVNDTEEFIELYKKCQKSWLEDVKGYNSRAIKKVLGIESSECGDLNLNFSLLMGKEDLVAELEAYQSVLIVDMAMKARKEYRTFCKLPENRHEITNDSLLQEALELVKSDADARAYFQSKFSCIYVDEFQDTDLVQRDLIEILCQDPNDPSKRREGVLFFVGDPKQSIYAFRGADVDVYEDTKKKYEAAAIADVEEYVLDDNYRSEKPIVEWVNATFSAPFTYILSNGYSGMNAPRDNSDGSGIIRGVYKFKLPNWISDSKAPLQSKSLYPNIDMAKERESLMITAIVKHLVDDGFLIWDKKDDKPFKREIEYRDFLILCPKKKDINIYANVLKKEGIPINLYGALDNKNEDVVVRVLQLYKALTLRYDSKTKHGAMEVLMGARLGKKNIVEAKARYELLLKKTENMTGIELLQYLSHHLEYVLTEKTTGEEASRTRSRLQQMLENVQAQPLGDKQDVYKSMLRYMDADIDKELSIEADANAVRFMNLHKAKGLEGKIVIICDRGKKNTSDQSSYRTMRDYYPSALKNQGIVKTYLRSYARDSSILSEVDKKMRNEYVRQDYVEATRAQEALIFMDALYSNCYFNEYDYSSAKSILDVSTELKKDVEDIFSDAYTLGTGGVSLVNYDTDSWDFSMAPKQGFHQEHSVTPSAMEHDDKATWNPSEESSRPCGKTFGIVMHRCFELLVRMLRKGATFDLHSIIRQALMENYVDIVIDCSDDKEREEELKYYEDYLEGRLSAFLSDIALINEIKAAKDVFTELSFSQYADPKDVGAVDAGLDATLQTRFALDDKEAYWINGQADLIMVDASDNVIIVDYKSDHIGKESIANLESHLHAAYDHQQELYRFAISQALGISLGNISYRYYHMYR